jgi:YVTN family beta-propeller protein
MAASFAATSSVVHVAPVGAAVCHPSCVSPFPDPAVYVANTGSGTLSVIDGITDRVVATVNVGSAPTGVVVDPVSRDVYVTNADSNSVSVVSPVTNNVIATVALGPGTAPTGVAVTPNGSTVFVADSGADEVSVIATSTNTVSATIAVGNDPAAVTVSPNGTTAYVTDALSKAVSVISTSSDSVLTTVGVGYFPSAVTASPVGNNIYVVNQCGNDPYCHSPGTLSVITASTNKVKTYQVGYEPVAVTITPNAETLYVVNACGPSITPPPKTLPGPDCENVKGVDTANVTTFDATTMTVDFDPSVDSAQPGVVEGAASSPDGSAMFVASACGSDPTCGSGGTVDVFNTDIGTAPVAVIPVGDDPTGIAFSGPWVPQRNQSSLTTDEGPAITAIASDLYAVEVVGGTVMYESYDTLTGGWSAGASVPGSASALAPAVSAVGNTLWVAWTTSASTIEFNELNTTTGTWAFTPGNIPPVPSATTGAGPALADVQGTMYVAWQDRATDRIGYESNVAGSWTGQAFVPSATTGAPPAIAALPGGSTLYFAWRSQTTNQIFFDFLSGTFASATAEPQAATNFGPALAVTPSGVYLLWKGATTDKLGYALDTPSGWTQQQFVPSALTGTRTSLAALGSNLFTAWQGLGHTTFWYDSLD